MTAVLYGIKNCDTVKKARKWLERHGIEYRFHDLRNDGLSRQQVQAWLDELGLDAVVNRRGTTWRQLDESTRKTLTADNAAALIALQPQLIKRPLLDLGHQRLTGFSDALYGDVFKQHTL